MLMIQRASLVLIMILLAGISVVRADTPSPNRQDFVVSRSMTVGRNSRPAGQTGLYVAGPATVTGDASVAGDMTVTGALNTTGNTTEAGDKVIEGDLTVEGDSQLETATSNNTHTFEGAVTFGSTTKNLIIVTRVPGTTSTVVTGKSFGDTNYAVLTETNTTSPSRVTARTSTGFTLAHDTIGTTDTQPAIVLHY